MKIKINPYRAHDLAFGALLGVAIAAVWWLVTGSHPSPAELWITGWIVIKGGSTLAKKSRSREIEKLKALHDLPSAKPEKQ